MMDTAELVKGMAESAVAVQDLLRENEVTQILFMDQSAHDARDDAVYLSAVFSQCGYDARYAAVDNLKEGWAAAVVNFENRPEGFEAVEEIVRPLAGQLRSEDLLLTTVGGQERILNL